MATKELIIVDGNENWGFNVTRTVGINGKNYFGDVLLIQAMFRHLVKNGIDSFFEYSGVTLPEVNGQYDLRLGRLILSYQRTYNSQIKSVDGLIHPANYKTRNVISNGLKRLMTITLLHEHMCLTTGSYLGDYVTPILNQYPRLRNLLLN